MGYHARVRESELRVRVEDFDEAMRLLWAASELPEDDNPRTFDDALDCAGWQLLGHGPQIQLSGYMEVERYTDKYGEDELLFWQTVAPIVDGGSFVEFEGEDGELWRWDFRRGKLIESTGYIAWVPTTKG